MADFNVIETQEQLDSIIGERLTRQRTQLEEKFKGFLSPDDFASKTQDLNDQIAGLTEQLAAANAKSAEYEKTITEKDALIKTHETASVKSRIAHEMGLSYEAISFLQGEDEDSIKKSAESLKGLVGKNNVPPLANYGKPADDSKTEAYKNMLKDLSN